MAQRKAISKKLRFNIFKRDEFTCQYCGETPPKTVLEIDHIMPVSKGGDNSEENLITSCYSCNRGKGAETIDVAPISNNEKLRIKQERLAQYSAYLDVVQGIDNFYDELIDRVECVLSEAFDGYVFKERFRRVSVRRFIDELGVELVIDNMCHACNRVYDPEGCISYFCKMCWNQIKETRK
jgi:hypothetical protein